jgi:DNA gyrase subunit A
VTKLGFTSRVSLRPHRETSTRAGRKFARVVDGDDIVMVTPVDDDDHVACATVDGHALVVEASEIPVLAGPGKGVMLVKLHPGDAVIGAQVLKDKNDAMVVESEGGRKYEITPKKYGGTRAGRGAELFRKGALARVVLPEITLPGIPAPEDAS